MDKKELIAKIVSKKEFSKLPKKDVEKVFEIFDKEQYVDEEKIKLARDLLRKVFSVFTSGKLLNTKVVDKKSVDEILKKHISTKERFNFYLELYSKLFKGFEGECSVIDLGAGINGLSYDFLREINKKVFYLGIEAVGQLVDLMNYYFKTRGLENAMAVHESIFNLGKIKLFLNQVSGKKIVFLFKTLDSLEMVERDYSKKLLSEIVPLADKVVVSFATRSLVSGKKFAVKRYWFENFVKENFKIEDDFELGNERYVVFSKKNE